MKHATRKLSGPAMERFLERLFGRDGGLDGMSARRLAEVSGAAISSLRVRRSAWAQVGRHQRGGMSAPRAQRLPGAPAKPEAAAEATAEQRAAPGLAFDPYAFGLVPVFQREGRDGLIARLEAVASADHLRHMARAQQIVLPAELRTGEVAIEALRAAIADAVAKRIADRRAAAG